MKQFTAKNPLYDFVKESNKIEGIYRAPTPKEIEATSSLIELPSLKVYDIEQFVAAVQPGARLRSEFGMDVIVGDHRPPIGNPNMAFSLGSILYNWPAMTPYRLHENYERLHPFMDGNGRSGRAIWLWHMKKLGKEEMPMTIGFLHTWYYQSLSEGRA